MNLRTPGATKIVGALALLLVVALGWLLVVGPKTAALSDTRAQITSVRDQNDTLAIQLISLKRQAQQLDDVRRTARAVALKFPPTADQPGVFKEITAAASDAGIGAHGLTSITPTPPVVGGADPATGVQLDAPPAGLARQTVAVAVTGSYDQMQRLLENLEQMPRAYLINSVAVSGDAGKFTTTISGDMFVMAPVEDPGDLSPEAGS
jgi:Tfp pilus assembly protein PilO